MTAGLDVDVWTMRVDGIDEPAAAWGTVLDATEQARAARFVFSRDRVAYIAAHALLRAALTAVVPDAHPGAWRLVADERGKPAAWLGDRAAPLSFNLSHAEGIVGVAIMPLPGFALGFDLEALARKVTLEIADRYFRPEEVAWLRSLEETDRSRGFLRLWTLKEAFIKATGEGLARDLATFWFVPTPPRIHFIAVPADRTEDWHFEQRVIGGRFIAAAGLHRPAGTAVALRWIEVDAAGFRPDLALSRDQGSGEASLRTLL